MAHVVSLPHFVTTAVLDDLFKIDCAVGDDKARPRGDLDHSGSRVREGCGLGCRHALSRHHHRHVSRPRSCSPACGASARQDHTISWTPGPAAAKQRVAIEERVTFLSMHFEGEPRSEELLEMLEDSKLIRGLAAETINLVASFSTHARTEHPASGSPGSSAPTTGTRWSGVRRGSTSVAGRPCPTTCGSASMARCWCRCRSSSTKPSWPGASRPRLREPGVVSPSCRRPRGRRAGW